MVTSKVPHLVHFGFRDIAWINASKTRAFIMHFEHDCRGLFAVHLKKPFEYMNDEFHWSEIVIQK